MCASPSPPPADSPESSIWWPGHCGRGPGVHAFIARVLQGTQRIAVIADRHVQGQAVALLGQAAKQAGSRIVVVHEGIPSNPGLADVRSAAARIRAASCDALIAVGGGSVIDVAKVAYACVFGTHDDPLAWLDPNDAWSAAPPSASDPVFLAIPTTAGTGSESSTAALIKDEAGRKLVFRSLRSRPGAVALVPELTLGLPPAVTAASGFDALLHAFGALVNECDAPVAEALAAAALARALDAYPRVLAEPDDLRAREDMLMASYLAGVAIGMKRVDAVHGLCTPLEDRVALSHGQVLAAIFDPIAEFSVATAHRRYARAARLGGLAGPEEDDGAAARKLLDAVRRMRSLGGLPDRLPALELDTPQALELADRALRSPSTRLNPRPLDRDAIAGLYLDIAARSRSPHAFHGTV